MVIIKQASSEIVEVAAYPKKISTINIQLSMLSPTKNGPLIQENKHKKEKIKENKTSSMKNNENIKEKGLKFKNEPLTHSNKKELLVNKKGHKTVSTKKYNTKKQLRNLSSRKKMHRFQSHQKNN